MAGLALNAPFALDMSTSDRAQPSPTSVTARRRFRSTTPRRLQKIVERHDDKLTLILVTAANLFAEFGYESTSLEMLAERLDMHKATLYHYISGKEEILFQCQLRSFAEIESIYDQVKDETRPVLERLRVFVVQLAKSQNSDFGRCLVLVGPQPLAEAAGGEIRKFQRRLDTIVRDLVSEGIARGELRECDPALVSALLFGALNWVPRWYKPEGRYSVPDIANAYFDLIEPGLRAQPGAAPVGQVKGTATLQAKTKAKAANGG